MSLLKQLSDGVSRWLDRVAATALAMLERFVSPRTVRLIEQDNGDFLLQSSDKGAAPGSSMGRLQVKEGQVVGRLSASVDAALRGGRAELVLRPDRFMFKPLELPLRASEFLDGIVRAQIDRLTPWSPGDAAFGWTPPTEIGPGRIVVTVAATARALLAPYLQTLTQFGVHAITVSTLLPNTSPDSAPIKVFEEKIGRVLDVRRMHRMLLAILVAVGLAATAATVAAAVAAVSLGAQQDDLARQIAQRRAAMRATPGASTDPATAARRALEARKYQTPSSVLVIEALSQILPDHTYVTELRIEGDKLQLTGVTRDAPSLIRLIEQSPQFTRATFFAPTTRAPSDPGDRFHIQARLEPVFSPRS
jgi:general secretion pathway protein L